MREKIAGISKIVDLSYLQLVIIFCLLALLEAFNVIDLPLDYRLFAIVIALCAIPTLMVSQRNEGGAFRRAAPILIAAFLFAPKHGILASRRAIRAGGAVLLEINQPRMNANER